MCEYSLMSFPNRLAHAGEDLIVHRFSSGSMGLAPPYDLAADPVRPSPESAARPSFWTRVRDFFLPGPERPVTAVCIPPCSRLALHRIPDCLQTDLGVQNEEEVVFEELTAEANQYRDAVRFSNGRVLRLQQLPERLRVTVLDLGNPRPAEGDLGTLSAAAEMVRVRGR